MIDAMFTKLESERIILRRFRDSDIEPFYSYRADPDVARYQDWENYTLDEAKRFLEVMRSRHPGTPGEWFQFALQVKATSNMIGDCGLLTLQEEAKQAVLGITIATKHQGKGYAMEAVTCLLDYVFSSLGMHRVRAITDCKNARSIALLERVGMRREGHFLQNVWFKGAWGDEYSYAILRGEWICRAEEHQQG